MTYLTVLPILALMPVLVISLTALLKNDPVHKHAWVIVALFCGLFTTWTIFAVVKEGLIEFWPMLTQDLWGNQVWFDLLMAFTMVWVLILPRAKVVGMKLPFWLLFIFCSGSVGLSAMLARLLYLEGKHASA